MQEEADAVVTAALAKRAGQRQQVVIVYPDKVVGLKNFVELRGEEDTKRSRADDYVSGHIAS